MSMTLFGAEQLPAAEAIAELCFTNPFSARRIELEQRALGSAFRDGQSVWNRASSRFENPNLPALRERTISLLRAAHTHLERGKAPSASERRIYEDVARYHLFDRFDDDLTALVGTLLQEAGGRIERITFYKAFLSEVERVYGVRGVSAQRIGEAPHLFATSVQVRFAFALIYQGILGSSACATQLRAATWQSIFTHDMRRYERALYDHMQEIPTLVLGPSGTGKELVARAVGLARYVPFDAGTQRFASALGEDFRALNLSAMAPTLIESELFGHRRGAFTGAVDERRGFFELCGQHGAVFLDEIGELEHGIQVKLLRVLQSRQFQRVGDTGPRAFRGKVIAATNRELSEELAAGTFRADLFYRLCADIVRTPKLSEQLAQAPEDLRTFVENAVERTLGESEELAPLATAIVHFVERKLGMDYAWPGNVRELEQCVRSFIVQGDYTPLPRAAQERGGTGAADLLDRELARADLTADQLLDRYCAAQHAQHGTYQDVARKLGLDWRTVKARTTRTSWPR